MIVWRLGILQEEILPSNDAAAAAADAADAADADAAQAGRRAQRAGSVRRGRARGRTWAAASREKTRCTAGELTEPADDEEEGSYDMFFTDLRERRS